MRGTLLAGFFACASVGSVLGVMLGGVIASNFGWKAAFGVVGIPGLVLALLYLKVRDYKTVDLAPAIQAKRQSLGEAVAHIVKVLARSRTMLWGGIGGSAQLIVVSAMWAWLPSFLNRVQGMDRKEAALNAAMVVLAGAAGAVVWGAVVDRVGTEQPGRKLAVMALLCLVSLAVLMFAFGGPLTGSEQFAVILLGGFMMTCSNGPVSAIVIDVIHPGVRHRLVGLALFQNLFGLAAGPSSPACCLTPSADSAPPRCGLRGAGRGRFLVASRGCKPTRPRCTGSRGRHLLGNAGAQTNGPTTRRGHADPTLRLARADLMTTCSGESPTGGSIDQAGPTLLQ